MTPARQRLAIEERIAVQEGRGSLGPAAALALAELRSDFVREEEARVDALLASMARAEVDPRILADMARDSGDLDAVLEDLARADDRPLFPALPLPEA